MARSSRQKSDSSGSGRRGRAGGARRPAVSRTTAHSSARGGVRSSVRSGTVSRSVRDSRNVDYDVGRNTGRDYGRNVSRNAGRDYSRDSGHNSGRTVSEINKLTRNQERNERRKESMERAARATRRPLIIIGIIVGLVIVVMASIFVASRTDLFLIEEVRFTGAEHLTANEADALVSVPDGTTLLNVDTDSIEASLMRDSWVQSVDVKRDFPSTLEIVVHEREVAAVVEIPMGQAQTIQNWLISTDGIWIMAIPNKDSEIGQQISPRIYEDADACIHITGVEVGVVPEMGKECTDRNVSNALEIITGLTTALADQIKSVSASDVESTTLTLKSNVEIAFGTADNIRDKERVCLEIMEKNPKVVYINVRVVDRPTWRSPE